MKRTYFCADVLPMKLAMQFRTRSPETYMHQPVGFAGGGRHYMKVNHFSLECNWIKSKPASKYIEKYLGEDLKEKSDF